MVPDQQLGQTLVQPHQTHPDAGQIVHCPTQFPQQHYHCFEHQTRILQTMVPDQQFGQTLVQPHQMHPDAGQIVHCPTQFPE